MNFATGYILTKAGEALHAKVEAGTTLKLTKMQLGSGTVTTVDDYYERSALVEPKNAMPIAEIQQVTAEKNMCVATAVLTNAAVDTSYMASELGLFAQNTDGTEILYAVSYDDHPSYIASKNDGTDITMKFSMYIVATSEITITLTLPKTAEEIATVAAGYAAQAAESELKAKQLEATANNYLQTTQQAMTLANGYANISKAWAEGNASPDGVADTDSPTGYTQSAKIWAALSKEYAGLSKFKLPIGYYKSVAEMKTSETAIVGRPCVTLGYYEPNDGGGGVYIIRQKKENDVDDGGSVLFLDNGNVAELIIEGAVNVKQFGANGDGVHDDTAAFVAASKAGVNAIIPHGSYVVDNGVVFDNAVVDEGTYINLKPAYKNNDILINELGNCYKVGNVSYGTAFSGANQQGATYNSKTNEILLFVGLNNFATQHILCVSPSDCTITRSFDYTTLGHAGTLEYDAELDNIYVVTPNNTITIINATSMSIEGTLNIDGLTTGSLFAFKYDKVTGCWVALLHDGSVSVYINVYNTNFELIRQSVLNLPDSQTVNGCAVRNGNVLLATWTHFIQFDIFGNLKKYIYGLITRQEPEDFYYIGDNLYYVVNGSTTQIWQVRVYEKQGDIAYNPYNTMGFYGVGRRNVDLNTITDAGCYAVYRTVSDSLNYPGNHGNGILLVYCYPINGIRQIFLTNGALETTDKYIYSRMYHFGSSPGWSTWQRFATSDEVISSYRNGWASGGYVKFGSALGGLTIQYCVTQINGTVDITFPISFTTGCIAVIPQITNGATDFTQYAVTDTPSKTGATITANATGNRAVRWVAFGY